MPAYLRGGSANSRGSRGGGHQHHHHQQQQQHDQRNHTNGEIVLSCFHDVYFHL